MAPDAPKFNDNVPLYIKVNYPNHEWWNVPYYESEREEERKFKNELQGADIVIMSDTDVDGLGCMALMEKAFPNHDIGRIEAGHGSGMDSDVALEMILTHAPKDADLYITDICFNDEDIPDIVPLLLQVSETREIHLFDHHEWNEKKYNIINSIVDQIDIQSDEEEEMCATDILFQHMKPHIRANNPDELEKMEELTHIIRDHDLWIKEDPRSNDLSSLQFHLDNFEYVEEIKKHGVKFMEDEELRSIIFDARRKSRKEVEIAVKRAQWEEIYDPNTGETITVALTYGSYPHSMSSQALYDGMRETFIFSNEEGHFKPIWNEEDAREETKYDGWVEIDEEEYDSWEYDEYYELENKPEPTNMDAVIEELREHAKEEEIAFDTFEDIIADVFTPFEDMEYQPGDANLVVTIPPWDKAHFRGDEKFDVCDVLAERRFNGGGHNKAAGGETNLINNDTDYSIHWQSRGKKVINHILEVVEEEIENGILTGEVDVEDGENPLDDYEPPTGVETVA